MIIKVMSSNIRFENPEDGKQDWPHRKHLLSSYINEFSPWLLGTQEGRFPQLVDLLKLTPHLKMAADHRDWLDNRMYPCIFFDPTYVKIIKSGDIWLSKTPYVPGSKSFGSAFPRLCTWIHGIFPPQSQEFFYINTHLDHLKPRTRLEQIKVLFEEINKILTTKNIPLLLSGDFNEAPMENLYQNIFSLAPILYDPWITLAKAEETSFHKFKKDYREDPKLGSRIDWILASKDFIAQDITLDKRDDNGIYPSDHYPLKAIFKLTTKP